MLFFVFASGQGVFALLALVHAMFLEYMAYSNARALYQYTLGLDEKRGESGWVPQGLKILAFGIIEGAGAYLSGLALSTTADTLLKMIGMNNSSGNRDFDTLYSIANSNSMLFNANEGAQFLAPVMYVVLMEVAIISGSYFVGPYVSA